MRIEIIGSTKNGYEATKEELENLSGHAAGVCYMPNSFSDLLNEPEEKTIKRANMTKISGHHSVFGHPHITLSFEDIPKGLALLLNNENAYDTSEKSARYTKMKLTPKEQELYDKWSEIFIGLITEKYQNNCPTFFTDKHIVKLAQENARYLISVFTPTTMVHTLSYRQLNYIYGMLKNEIENENSNEFMQLLKPSMIDFCNALDKTPYVDYDLQKGIIKKARVLSLFNPRNYLPEEYFGDVYSVNYEGSFASLGQAQRHRTLNYSINLLDEKKFYIPPILRNNQALVDEWIKDCNNEELVFPQATLVSINEQGNIDNLILKAKERKCSCAQIEIDNQTTDILNRYSRNLKEKNHPRAEELEKYTHGSRCTFPDYKCDEPCRFIDGINGTRQI